MRYAMLGALAGLGLLTGACAAPAAQGVAVAAVASERAVAAPVAPLGFVEMQVTQVLSGAEGHMVLLADVGEARVLPITVGSTEALSIHLRSERRRFQRPLTHDLLDRVMDELGGRVVKVHIDGIKGGTFLGTLYLRRGAQDVLIDARPSDSIAMALGSRAPIFVAEAVLEQAAIPHEVIERIKESARREAAQPDDPSLSL